MLVYMNSPQKGTWKRYLKLFGNCSVSGNDETYENIKEITIQFPTFRDNSCS